MPSETERRPSLPDVERERQDRRLLKQIRDGRCMSDLRRTFNLSEDRIGKLAAKHGLTIAKGVGRR